MKSAVGVDGGGSTTVAVRFDDGRAARGGPSNPSSLGVEASASTIASLVRQLTEDDVDVFVGAAGAGRGDIAAALRSRLETLLGGASRVHVEGDARIALRAAIREGPGVIVHAGTGSFAYAEDGENDARVGGAGYLLGDEGSGFAIGIAGLRAYARILEGRFHDDELADCVRGATDALDRDALLAFAYRGSPSIAAVASVAPAIVALAGRGHRGATRIVQTAAGELADLAKAAAKNVGLLERAPAVALTGGLMQDNTLLSYLVETRIAADIPGASIVRSQDPDGAALAAARLAAGMVATAP